MSYLPELEMYFVRHNIYYVQSIIVFSYFHTDTTFVHAKITMKQIKTKKIQNHCFVCLV